MLLIGLTGGIGSGKSTVARMLAERGAVVFDADELAHRAIEPATRALSEVVERFGRDIRKADGAIDRRALARIVFADAQARRDLEAIVHPEIARRFSEEVERHRDTQDVVVFDAALLVETGHHRACDVLVVVTAPEEKQVARTVAGRGLTEQDVRARMSAQMPLAEKAAIADVIIDHGGPIGELG